MDRQDQLEMILPYSYYHENIFSPEDYYLYKAILLTYAGEYESSNKDLDESAQYKARAKEENENSDSDSDESNQTDLSDVGLCSLNVHELTFNKAVNLLLMGDQEKALECLNKIIEQAPAKYSGKLFLL